jgi:hypothetical protein
MWNNVCALSRAISRTWSAFWTENRWAAYQVDLLLTFCVVVHITFWFQSWLSYSSFIVQYTQLHLCEVWKVVMVRSASLITDCFFRWRLLW